MSMDDALYEYIPQRGITPIAVSLQLNWAVQTPLILPVPIRSAHPPIRPAIHPAASSIMCLSAH